jgi:hypothetical protein
VIKPIEHAEGHEGGHGPHPRLHPPPPASTRLHDASNGS